MAFGRAAFGRGTITDFGFAGNQGRLSGFLCLQNRPFNLRIIMAVNLDRIPADRLKTLNLIRRVGFVDRTVNRNIVIVPENYQLI